MKEETEMTPLGYWLLTAACGILGVIDVVMFLKTPKEKRTKLHWAVMVCGAVVLAMAVAQAVSLIVRGQPI
jgi:FtsH-binding integral membrane protein